MFIIIVRSKVRYQGHHADARPTKTSAPETQIFNFELDDLDEYENEIEDGDEGEDEENNSTRLEHGLTNRYFNFK